jgi:formylmethanofuran dehydrogenase subunit B
MVDAVLIVGSVASVPPALIADVARLPTVVIGPRATEQAPQAVVAIDTGVVGIHESGTALRLDDVALPLTGTITGPPATFEVVAALAGRL